MAGGRRSQFKNILIGYDGSAQRDKATDSALALAQSLDATVILFAVTLEWAGHCTRETFYPASRAIHVSPGTIDIAVEQLKPQYMRGYCDLSEAATELKENVSGRAIWCRGRIVIRRRLFAKPHFTLTRGEPH